MTQAQTFHALLDSLSSSAKTDAPAITVPAASPSHAAIDLSYQQLYHHVQAFADALKQIDVKGGDVVSLSLSNSIEFVGAFLATGWIRAVSAPLNPAYSQDEIEFYLQDTKSSLLIVKASEASLDLPTLKAAKKCGVRVASIQLDPPAQRGKGDVKISLKTIYTPPRQSSTQKPSQEEEIANANQRTGGPVEEQDVALVLHTSGTTGRPKAVPLTHLNIMTTMRNIANTYEFTSQDRGLLVMPLFHVHGLVAGLLAPLLSGSSIVIAPKFSAKAFWNEFTTERCNWYTAVPTIHSILLSSPLPSPLPHIRFIRSCSSSLSPTVFHKLEQTFKAPVLEAYAMSEAAHQMTASPLPHNGPRYPGSVGIPQGVGLTIRDPSSGKAVRGSGEKARGEVCIRGKNVMLGYVNNEKANREGYWDPEDERERGIQELRWFRTGDEGFLTDKGYLVLTGRLKEVSRLTRLSLLCHHSNSLIDHLFFQQLINRGGEKISPIELDSAILSLPNIAEAVSFGVADEKYGEKVWAVVVVKNNKDAQGDEQRVENEVKEALKHKVARFKIPERVIVTEAIPKYVSVSCFSRVDTLVLNYSLR